MKIFTSVALVLFHLAPITSQARWKTPDEADYSYEISKSEIYVPKDGRARFKSHYKIKVLNELGRDSLGTLTFSYSPSYERFSVYDASVRFQNKTINVTNENIVDKPIRIAELGFDDNRQVMVSFPMVQVGSEIEYYTKSTIKLPNIKNAYSDKFSFGLGGLENHIDYKIESERKLFMEVNDPNNALDIVEKVKKNKFIYSIKNKAPIYHRIFDETESLLLDSQLTWVKVSTVENYSDMFKDMAEKYERKISAPLPNLFREELTALITEPEPLNKVAKTLAFIAGKIRYMGDWRSVQGGLIPRDLTKIAETQSGDCKDLSILTIKFLRELGINAWVALVYRGQNPPASSRVPYISYNHAIVMVELGDKKLWLDPTNFQSFADGVFEDISGRKALIMNPAHIRLEEIAFSPMDKNIEISTKTSKILSNDRIEITSELFQTGLLALPVAGAHLQYSKEQFEESTLANFAGRQEVLKYKMSIPELTNRIVKPFKMKLEWETPLLTDMTTMGPAFYFLPPYQVIDMIKIKINKRNSGFRLGPPQKLEYISQYKNIEVKGRQLKNCSAKSKWVDYFFDISYSPVKIVTKYNRKVFSITADEIQSKEFLKFQNELKACGQDKYIVYSKN